MDVFWALREVIMDGWIGGRWINLTINLHDEAVSLMARSPVTHAFQVSAEKARPLRPLHLLHFSAGEWKIPTAFCKLPWEFLDLVNHESAD